MASMLITPQRLRELLDYDPESGKLYWRPRSESMFDDKRIWRSWNGRYAGKEALTADNGKGYKFGVALYQRIYAHRAAWALHHGSWPEQEIDHRDRDRGNNRIANLRDVSHLQNCANQGQRATNVSGHRNVLWDGSRSQWVVRFRRGGRLNHVGRFNAIAEAVSARDAALAIGG